MRCKVCGAKITESLSSIDTVIFMCKNCNTSEEVHIAEIKEGLNTINHWVTAEEALQSAVDELTLESKQISDDLELLNEHIKKLNAKECKLILGVFVETLFMLRAGGYVPHHFGLMVDTAFDLLRGQHAHDT